MLYKQSSTSLQQRKLKKNLVIIRNNLNSLEQLIDIIVQSNKHSSDLNMQLINSKHFINDLKITLQKV